MNEDPPPPASPKHSPAKSPHTSPVSRAKPEVVVVENGVEKDGNGETGAPSVSSEDTMETTTSEEKEETETNKAEPEGGWHAEKTVNGLMKKKHKCTGTCLTNYYEWAYNWNVVWIVLALILILLMRSGHNFAHVMTAAHVQNCDLIQSLFFFQKGNTYFSRFGFLAHKQFVKSVPGVVSLCINPAICFVYNLGSSFQLSEPHVYVAINSGFVKRDGECL